jgi:hypothetical protein
MFKSWRGPREVGTERERERKMEIQTKHEGHNYNHRTLTKQNKNTVGICTTSGAANFEYNW